MSQKKRILITPGDPEGIGPEITWKALRKAKFSQSGVEIVCVGAAQPFQEARIPIIPVSESDLWDRKPLPRASSKKAIYLTAAPQHSTHFLPGFQSGWSIDLATRLALAGKVDALVTGPISKERLQKGGYPYPGHTEFLAEICKVPQVTMMLANDILRISLVTTHVALKDVPRELTRERFKTAVFQTAEHLSKWWGIQAPKIGIAALNPHAGESGLFGTEEIEVIVPEMRAMASELKKKHGATLFGPLSADTLFANHVATKPKDRFDAVVCMYHDQGLIPVKLLDFKKTINVTLGLPIVRTSVDHGVAFDIAGTGKADPSSLESAIAHAVKIVGRSKLHLRSQVNKSRGKK